MKYPLLIPFICFLLFTFSCSGEIEHIAAAIDDKDSLPFMHSRGINTFISDSGVTRYHMVAEEWDIYNISGEPTTWKFKKGLLMERFDENFHIDLYVQSDTAYLHKQQTWELRGRVTIRNAKGDIFRTSELFWDMNNHEIWSHQFIDIQTPERNLQGYEFRSNEDMTKYSINNSSGTFPVSDTENTEQQPDTISAEKKQDIPVDTPNTTEEKTMPEPTPTIAPGRRFPPAPNKQKEPLKLQH